MAADGEVKVNIKIKDALNTVVFNAPQISSDFQRCSLRKDTVR